MTTTAPAMRILSVEPLATVRNTKFDAVTAEVPGYREPWRCGLVRRPNAAAVLPYDQAEGVYVLARQPRIGLLGGRTLEAPAGVFDDPADDPQETAARELGEELGLAAETWTAVAEGAYASPGYSDERLWLYLAEGLSVVPSREEDGYITAVRMPLDGIFDHIKQYRRSPEADMKTLLLLTALANRL
jgi:ADP-ribose pyrophosphatase